MYKNVIFDLGNVLIEWNADNFYNQYFANTSLRDQFYETTQIKQLNVELDRGLPFNHGLNSLVERHPDYHDAIWQWKSSWEKMLGKVITGTLDILYELKSRNLNLYALTNWAAETFSYAEQNFPWLDNFLDIVVSGREGVVKPELEIYQRLLMRNGLQANECVFIDDSLTNVEAAAKLGINGVHFQSVSQLRYDLQQLKLL